jgi:hypothetical protein
MKRWSRRIAALAGVAVLGAVLISPQTASAQPQTLEVSVGTFDEQSQIPAEGMRFYAPNGELTIHSGDTVFFNQPSFHTATLLPTDVEDPLTWLNENYFAPGGAWSLIVPDPDDTQSDPGASSSQPSMKFNNAVFFPSDLTGCGAPTSPCPYDGTTVENTGAGIPGAFTINAPAGETVWVVCLIHPNMIMKINVVEESSPTTTQDEIDDYLATQGEADLDAAARKHRRLSDRHVRKDGKWQAWAGFDGEGYALLAMYPRKHTIRRGQSVEWNFSQLVHESHTVTFPFKGVSRPIFNRNVVPVCDPDGDAGTMPDNPPDMEEPPFCAIPTQLELDFEALFLYEQGNGKFRGSDYENSGVRGAPIPSTLTEPYSVQFPKVSGKKGYKYFCMIHGPFQQGTIVVKKRR